MDINVLLKGFNELLEMEKRAKYFYDHYIEQIEDKEIKEELVKVRDDEIEHIQIAERLMEYIK